MSEGHEVLKSGDAASRTKTDMNDAAGAALKGAVQGAAVGGLAGAVGGAIKSGAIALGKSKAGQKVILGVLAISLIPMIAIMLVISMLGSMSGSNAYIRNADNVASIDAAYGKNFQPEEVAVFQYAGAKYNVPWELLAAIMYVEKSTAGSGAGPYKLTLDPNSHQPVHKGKLLDYLSEAPESYAITDGQAEDLSSASDLLARVIRDSFVGNVNDLPAPSLTTGSVLTNSHDAKSDRRVLDKNNADDVASAKKVEQAYVLAIKKLPINDGENKASSIFERARQFALGQAGNAVCSALPVASGVWGDPLVAQTTSVFGPRIDPITGHALNHDGQDFAGLPEGTPFYSASDGTVLTAFGTGGAEGDGDGGNGIIIDAGGGVQLWYWHASPGTAKVKAGDKVRTGQVLAGIGTSGHSTGVHLHFQIMENGVAVDPVAFMAARGVKLGTDPVGGASSSAPITATTTNWDNAQAFTANDANGIPITLSPEQLANASIIIGVGKALGLNDKDIVVALITALQESKLKVLSNVTVFPESASIPNQGDGSDHDSLGIFQQRAFWGTPSQVMDPTDSAKRFYGGPSGPNHGSPAGLIDVLAARGGMADATPGEIAQAVQVSAFPDAYESWVPVAQQLISSVAGTATPASCAAAPSGDLGGGDVVTGITFAGDVSAARQDLIKYAEQGLGGNYVWGGTNFKAWDCSGYFQWIYKQTGVSVPRVEQWSAGKKTTAPKPGDLVVMHADGFDAAGKANHWSHVGMYAGEKNGQPMFYNALNPEQGTLLVAVSSVGDDAEYFNLFND